MELLLEPLSFPFMQRAALATIVVAVTCALVGTFVVSRGLAYVGDALAHASFAGIALALLLRKSIYLGAAAAAVATSLVINFLSRRRGFEAHTASGALFAGAFALGIVLISPARNYTADLFAYVFGNVLGIGVEDLWVICGAGGVVLVLLTLLYRPLVLVCFDPALADAEGLPVRWFEAGLLALVGLTVVAAIKALGIVLVVAMLVTPGATALLLTGRLSRALPLAMLLAAAAAVGGLYLSFYGNVASGASTVLISTLLFGSALLLPRRVPRRVEPESGS